MSLNAIKHFLSVCLWVLVFLLSFGYFSNVTAAENDPSVVFSNASCGTSNSAYIFEQTYGDRLGTLDVNPKTSLHFDVVRAWLQTTDISNAQVKLRIYKVSTALDPLPSGALIAESQLATVGETASEVSFSFGTYVDLSVGDRYVFAFTVDGHTWNYPDALSGWGHAASSGCDFWEHFIEYDDHTGATPNDIYTATNQLAISFVDTTGGSTVFSITATDANKLEGNNVDNLFLFKIERTGDTSHQAQIQWQVSTQNLGVDAADFSIGELPSGISTFDAGESTKELVIGIHGDTAYEPDESFEVLLSNASAGASIDPTASIAQAVIRNDDTSVVPDLTISNISPTSGIAGIVVTINGNNFGSKQRSSFVSFGSAKAAIKSWGNTKIKAVAPSGLSRSLPVIVTTAAGNSNSVNFTYPDSVKLDIETPLLLVRQDFSKLGKHYPQLELEVINVEVRERELGIEYSNALPSDECYLGASDAFVVQAKRNYISTALNILAADVFTAPIGVLSTGSYIGDFLLKLAAEMINSTILGVPLDETTLVFVAEKAIGYIARQATDSYIFGQIGSLVTKKTINNLLKKDDPIFWELTGNNQGSEFQQNGGTLTNINAEIFYSPFTHYITALIGATCNMQDGTKTILYIQRYEVVKTPSGTADMIEGTLRVVSKQIN